MTKARFDVSYRALLMDLMGSQAETNARTGADVRVLRGARMLSVSLEDGRLPVAGNRRYWPRIAAAEVAWQFQGTQDPTFIMKHAPKLWGKFLEPRESYVMQDPTQELPTSGADEVVRAAYGYRWRKYFGRDQLRMAMHALSRDPTNRQVFVSAWDPMRDGLGAPNQPKNLPCPVGFTLSCLGDEVHMSVFVRSSDVFVGLPYDVMSYALTLDAVAASLGRKPGELSLTLAHAHLYKQHWELAHECLYGNQREWVPDVEPRLPVWTVPEVWSRPDEYVEYVARLSSRVRACSDWAPVPELVE